MNVIGFRLRKVIITSQLICIWFAVLMIGIGELRTFTFNCDFNTKNDICGWSNAFKVENLDDFNWKYGSRSDGRQKGSGASDDHGGGGGYVYIKSKNKINRTARLFSPTINRPQPSCFQFWYFMKGRNLGHLEVLLAPNRNSADRDMKVLWNLRGHQGNIWKNAKVPLAAGSTGIIIIEAFDWAAGRSGNILVDDISIGQQISQCESVQPPYAAPSVADATTSTTSPNILLGTTKSAVLHNATNQDVMTESNTAAPNNPTSIMKVVNATVAWQGTVKQTLISESNSAMSYTVNVAVSPNTTNRKMAPQTDAPIDNTASPVGLNRTATDLGNTANVASDPTVTVAVVVSVLGVVIILVVALLVYLRRRQKPRNMYADDCSVVMTRMYPEITSETSMDYRKFT